MTFYKTRFKKYGNTKTEYNGRKYDSKFEAGVAKDLDLRLKNGEISAWEPQFKVEMWAYTKSGEKALKLSHRVDFRVHELDGSYTLIEAKGFETADYKMRKKWLLKLWMPENLDHTYEVVYEGKKGWRAFSHD